MMANVDLPQEIIEVIFSRLPAKSVGKCKCLSKYWSTYLSTSQFINLHLITRTRKPNNHENNNIIFLNEYRSVHIITSPLKYALVSKQIQLPNITEEWESVHGSCNGLVLLRNKNRDLFLVNPITLQQLKIPPRREFADTIDFKMFGFGYDRSGDDYKVVKLSWCEPRRVVDLYSVRRGAWKRVGDDNFPRDQHSFIWPRVVFLNGALHWLATRIGSSGLQFLIVAFDLEYEVFREIPLPNDIVKYCKNDMYILGGYCLSITMKHSSGCWSVWMMKEYGVVDSWISYRINNYSNGDSRNVLLRPLCFVSDDEFFCRGSSREWFVYNVKVQMAKHVVGEVSDYVAYICVFVDSLVSLDQYVVNGRKAECNLLK